MSRNGGIESRGGLPLTAQMERFSISYLRAVVAAAGYQISHPEDDFNGIDIHVSRGRDLCDKAFYRIIDPQIDIQMKSTSSFTEKDGFIHYSLKVQNYNLLIKNSSNPRLLILVTVPSSPAEWLLFSDEKLLLMATGYYCSLRGKTETSNISNITIHIPKTNLLSPDALHDLMYKTSMGEPL